MALTDYIPPEILASEGYIHKSQKEAMFEQLDRQFLAEQGYGDLRKLEGISVPVSKAAEIIGMAVSTLDGYVKLGYIRKDINGKIALLDAIGFDKNATKDKYLASKTKRSKC